MSEGNGNTTTVGKGRGLMGSGTVGGLFAFFDYLVDKKLATNATAAPLKSAARQVFETVEGTENIDEIDVRNLNVPDYLERFEIGARGTGRYKPESIQAYRSRFTRALQYYMDYLTTGDTPKFRYGSKGGTSAKSVKPGKGTTKVKQATPMPSATTSATPVAPHPATTENFISYPFPLESGDIATFRLPRQLGRADAERAAAFLRTLVYEPQKQLGAGRIEDDDPEPKLT
jgi:hypothetical protein